MDILSPSRMAFQKRAALTKEQCKLRLRSEIDFTIDRMFDFFNEEFEKVLSNGQSSVAQQQPTPFHQQSPSEYSCNSTTPNHSSMTSMSTEHCTSPGESGQWMGRSGQFQVSNEPNKCEPFYPKPESFETKNINNNCNNNKIGNNQVMVNHKSRLELGEFEPDNFDGEEDDHDECDCSVCLGDDLFDDSLVMVLDRINAEPNVIVKQEDTTNIRPNIIGPLALNCNTTSNHNFEFIQLNDETHLLSTKSIINIKQEQLNECEVSEIQYLPNKQPNSNHQFQHNFNNNANNNDINSHMTYPNGSNCSQTSSSTSSSTMTISPNDTLRTVDYTNHPININVPPFTHQQSGQNTTNPNCKVFQCEWDGCGRRFTRKCYLREHQQWVHQRTNGTTTSTAMMPRPFVCAFEGCGKLYRARSHLHEHERIHLGRRPFRCRWEGCQFRATDRSTTINHIRGIHFNLPRSRKEQRQRNIVDERDPKDYIEVIVEEL